MPIHPRAATLTRSTFRLLAAGMMLCGAGGTHGALAAEPTLEKVVLVQRHGVRAPTQAPETLAGWTARPWPTWPVGRGLLTPHGAQVVGLVAGGMRDYFVKAGVLPAQGCPGEALVVWADGKDARTRESGQMMADRLAPGCGGKAAFLDPAASKRRDPVFASIGGACVLDKAAARRAVAAAIQTPNGPQFVDPASATAIARMTEILRPGAPANDPSASTVVVRKSGIAVKGPLAVTANAAEIFLLEYAQGMPAGDVAWGEASDPAKLGVLLATRQRTVALTRALPYEARRQGAMMARLFLATLAGKTHPAAPAIGPGVKVLALAGHDTNLSNMAGVFGLDWTLPGQPDATAPATAFSLELWRDETGARSVTATIWYAELEGMRTLNAASVHPVRVPFPGCTSAIPGACPLEALSKTVLATIPDACGQ